MTNEPNSSDFLTPSELAARWKGRVSVGTLRNWRTKKIGPAYTKVGHKGVLYPLSAVEAFERSNLTGAAGEAAKA